jgi:hypothetical protein
LPPARVGDPDDIAGRPGTSEVGQDYPVTERTMCVVYTQPVAGREAEYNDWYDRQHLHDVARVPGVVSAHRFEPLDSGAGGDGEPRFLAIYEIDRDPREFVRELRSRFGTDQMPASEALDLASLSMTFWKARGGRPRTGTAAHHSELTDAQLSRLRDVLAGLGADRAFSATEALSAALRAGIENHLADIDSALSDLEDAGMIREVQKNPPRWQVV